jgi:hypothetical protein
VDNYRTAVGLRDGRELFDQPGSLDHIGQIWTHIRSATSELADWAEHTLYVYGKGESKEPEGTIVLAHASGSGERINARR